MKEEKSTQARKRYTFNVTHDSQRRDLNSHSKGTSEQFNIVQNI